VYHIPGNKVHSEASISSKYVYVTYFVSAAVRSAKLLIMLSIDIDLTISFSLTITVRDEHQSSDMFVLSLFLIIRTLLIALSAVMLVTGLQPMKLEC